MIEQAYSQTYLAELEKDLLNPQKPSKEFKKLTQHTQNPLSEMYIDKNEPQTLSKDQEKVDNHIYTFYNKLFAHQECKDDYQDLVDFMGDIQTQKITEDDNKRLEIPFSKTEVASFIKTMSNDKALGLTGISLAFYKVFWLQIGDLVTSAINNYLENHSLPPKHKIGLVTLNPKQDKDSKHIENLRPITLLSTFYWLPDWNQFSTAWYKIGRKPTSQTDI